MATATGPSTGLPQPGESLVGDSITVRFGGVTALDNVNFSVGVGEILGLIGPNGAGKTTLLNVLSGFQETTGRVHAEGRDVTDATAHKRARAGVVRTFQSVRVFGELTVVDNVAVGALCAGLRLREARHKARSLVAGAGLGPMGDRLASTLPYGAERRVGLLRSVAANPRFLLLDEPAAGLNEGERSELAELIRSIRQDLGCGVCIVEHDVGLIMGMCDRVHVLDHGKTVMVGAPTEVQRDERVIQAYIGRARNVANA